MARKKPIPRSARKEINRGTLRSRSRDNAKNISVGLMDIDGAIMFYFNNVIKPVVQENDESVKVPIMYSNPERWNTIQKNGFLLDNKKQLILPLIVFKRTSIEKDDTMSVDKLDPKDPKLFYTFQKQYTKENRYDNFAVQQGLNKSRELYTVAVPDYVSVTYEFVVWTSYTEQMNKIIEKIIFSEGAYWGEDGKFKFRTTIDSYTDASEFTVNSERIIKTNFTVTLKGYLIPEEDQLIDDQSSTADDSGPQYSREATIARAVQAGLDGDMDIINAISDKPTRGMAKAMLVQTKRKGGSMPEHLVKALSEEPTEGNKASKQQKVETSNQGLPNFNNQEDLISFAVNKALDGDDEPVNAIDDKVTRGKAKALLVKIKRGAVERPDMPNVKDEKTVVDNQDTTANDSNANSESELIERLVAAGVEGNMDEINALDNRVLRGKIKAAVVKAKRAVSN